jgi:endonuclease YncB( thermonuclease family)
MIDNKIVKLKKITTDRYNRVVGLVYYQNIEINHYLVRNGLAWCYDKYNNREKIKNAENLARKEKIGIWSNDAVAPIEPWKWRKNRKKNE